MIALSARRMAWIVAGIAALVYANAVLNGWAGDDVLIILDNARTHSATAAWHSWFLSYWPPPYDGAGLYRPLTILTYGVEWSLAGGKPWLFHLDNVLLHAAASLLVVFVALRWLPPLGAAAAGVLFAVHPVHVEAVSNVVGRAELMGAAALLSAVLAARRYRDSAEPHTARWWLVACLAIVLLGLLSKEHLALAVAVIAVDHALDRRPARRSMWPVYLGITWITVGWLFLWTAIAGEYVAPGATSALYGLTRAQRLSHMMPVQLDLVRLLAWPMDLAADYSPHTIPLRPQWGVLATLGLALVVALLALAFALARRAPAIAFGLLVAAGTYLPTSNLLFMSGVVLAERALYLGVLAPAFAFGWLCLWLLQQPYRRLGLTAAAVLVAAFALRTWTRTPYFRDAPTPIIEDAADHPENYREHLYLGDLVAFKRDTARALAEYLASAALAPHDPFVGRFTGRTAIALGRPEVAIAEGWRVHALAPDDPRPGRWLTDGYLAARKVDSALAVATRDAVRIPSSIGFIHTFQDVLRAAGAPPARTLLVDAKEDWLSGRLVQATARLDSFSQLLPEAAAAPTFCDDLVISLTSLRSLRRDLLDQAVSAAAARGQPCPAAANGGLPAPVAK